MPALPSSKFRRDGFDIDSTIDYCVREARVLEELGYTGVIIENFGDKPYPKRTRDLLTLSVISIVVREVVKSVSIPVGINILRNSGLEAYSIAVAAGAKFIRVNVLVETVVTDSGIIEAEAPRLRAIRSNYPGIKIYADIFVKHGISLNLALSSMLSKLLNNSQWDASRCIKGLIKDYVERGGADALIVTGLATGEAPSRDLVALIKSHSTVPVLVGSGVSPDNVSSYLEIADGVIVGSWIKVDGKAGNRVDPERASLLVKTIRNKGF